MINPPQKQPLLICDSDISELHNRPSGGVSEADLLAVLSRYNLRQGLITLGKASNYIASHKDENSIGRSGYRVPESGVMVTQFALAYLANLLLISGANDHKNKFLGDKQNWVVLCNLYSNVLIQPELLPNWKEETPDPLSSMLIRMYTEQFENFQFSPVLFISRTMVFFNDIAHRIIPKNGLPALPKVFEETTGLSITDYLKLATAIWAGAQQTATFRIDMLTNAEIGPLKDVINDERKVQNFIKILSADYRSFKQEDGRNNATLNSVLTKYRLNPLLVYPIIETDRKDLGDPFVIPNNPLYLKRAFGGTYWWFHRFFEAQNLQHEFRTYFGEIFQEYVGKILKGIYDPQNVHPEIVYGGANKFIDWWVEKDGKIYLFEAKAYQFALASKQTGGKEELSREVRKKIVEAMEQVYKRIADIPKFKELSVFRGKKIIPILVFLEMPFISGGILKNLIDEALKEVEMRKKLMGLKDLEIQMLNIEELEEYDGCSGTIALEDVFAAYKDNPREGFHSIITKNGGGRNRLLDKIYTEFWGEIGKAPEETM